MLPSSASGVGANALLKLDHAEIARQITLQMSELYRVRISRRDVVNSYCAGNSQFQSAVLALEARPRGCCRGLRCLQRQGALLMFVRVTS